MGTSASMPRHAWLPACQPEPGDVSRRGLARWAETAVLAKVHVLLVSMLRGHPDLILDTCSVRAKRGGDLTGPNPTDRGKQGSKYHIVTDGDGVPVACALTAANVNDTLPFGRLLLAALQLLTLSPPSGDASTTKATVARLPAAGSQPGAYMGRHAAGGRKRRMLHRRAALTLVGGTALAVGVGGASFRRAAATPSAPPRADRPEDVGLSSERLGRMTAWMRGEVEQGRVPGAVMAIGRKGRIGYLEAVGYRDREAGAPMTVDAVFGLASMTKPIASLALMILVEENKVQLGHPLSRYLPEFRDQKVGVARPVGGRIEMALEPAERPTTIQDLLRHTSGLCYDYPGDKTRSGRRTARPSCASAGSDATGGCVAWLRCP
jgi:hypothetical protein